MQEAIGLHHFKNREEWQDEKKQYKKNKKKKVTFHDESLKLTAKVDIVEESLT